MRFSVLLLGSLLLFTLVLLVPPFFVRPPIPDKLVDNMTTIKRESLYFDYEISQIPTGVEIVEITNDTIDLGITTDPWNLKFGAIPTGGSFGTREIKLKNQNTKNAKVNLLVTGNISPMVKFQQNDFILAPDEEVDVQVHLFTKNETNLGRYTGQIDMIIKIYRSGILENILGGFG